MAGIQKRLFSKKLIPVVILVLLVASVSGFFLVRKLLSNAEKKISGITTPFPIPIAGSESVQSEGISPAQAADVNVSIRLSEGKAQPQAVEPLLLAAGEPLPEADLKQIIDRLPALETAPGDQVDFKLAVEPIPPPRPGETIAVAFPPSETEPTQPSVVEPEYLSGVGPLQVLRFAPEGEIPIAPFVSVTFNQPMVPLGTLGDLSAEELPIRMEPSLPGVWRWLGAKTLTFEYKSELPVIGRSLPAFTGIDRLPKATEFRLTVPAGTKSAVGGVLAETVAWSFRTPPPKVISFSPYNSPQPLDPIFFVAFDQRIDPEPVLNTIQVKAGGETVSLVLASEADIQKDEPTSNLVKHATEGRWLVFRATKTLPPDTTISVTIGPGTPSAEGPLVTNAAQSFSFSTYAPLRIVEYRCSWNDKPCPPMTPFYIRFNNPIDTQVYVENLLRVLPEIPGVNVSIYGDSISIQGMTKSNTTYTVTVDGDIQDIFGQKLGQDVQLTFSVGEAEEPRPILFGPDQNFVTLDPAAKKPVFSVYALNYTQLEVTVYSVQPADFPTFQKYLREHMWADNPPKIPGRSVSDKTLKLEKSTTLTEVAIDLSQYMDGKYGHFILVVAPPKGMFESEQDRQSQTVYTWVQVTQIGLDAFNDHSEMVAWTTRLKDGAPLGGVTIRAGVLGSEIVTGDDGTARFAIPVGTTFLVASHDGDTALLPRSQYISSDYTWFKNPVSDELRWYVFDDRQMYRPGEEVHIKGWVRRIGGMQTGDVGLVGGLLTSVRYQVTAPQGIDLGGGQAEVNPLGGFDFAFTLPKEINLGTASINLFAEGNLAGLGALEQSHAFQIQEFRRPEFEVNARNETTGPYFTGGNAFVAVVAKYYDGDPLPNADVTWQVTYSPSSYSPPNWPDFTFGSWIPWWWHVLSTSQALYKPQRPGEFGRTEIFTGTTDASGIHYLRLDFDKRTLEPSRIAVPRPTSVLAEATVMDVNRQAWSSVTTLLVHPADLYIGLRSDRYFVERGTPIKVDFIVTDLDGNPVIDRPVEVRAARLEWKNQRGAWKEEEVDEQKCSTGSQLLPVTCTFLTPVGGSYLITAVVTDEFGRQNQSQFTRWVSGGQRPPSREVEQETVTLIPDKPNYQPGDVAEILVQSPFSPAEGLLTVSRSGILYTERFHIEADSITLKVPVEEVHIPNLNIQVDLVGAAPRSSDQGEILPDVPPRPAYATGQLNLSIPALLRTLSLQVTADPGELEPGGETSVHVLVKDASGQPVPDAELAVVVVDEAILALTNYQLTDPTSVFYTDRPSYLEGVYGRASIILVNPQALAEVNGGLSTVVVKETAVVKEVMVEAPAAAATATPGMGGAEATPIRMRLDFNPLATFAPAVHTDANGEAVVRVKLPDNLTRYRIMVVAVDGSLRVLRGPESTQGNEQSKGGGVGYNAVLPGRQFGMGESNLVARLPLMARPSAPRFLNFGDSFELPVVLQNQTDDPLLVDVVARASNLELVDGMPHDLYGLHPVYIAGLRVTVPARDRVEVRFPAKTIQAGTARLQIAAVSGAFADATTIELPVYTPATSEAFATYGVIDQGTIAQPVAAPSGVFPQYGGLEINTSSTALQALTDAVLYLVAYPFECTEQLASRILGIAALRDVLTAFKADGLPPPEEMQASLKRDVERLRGLQNDDGGFPAWQRGRESIPFNSIHVAHALTRAQQKGFEVPADTQQRVLEYLRNIESHYPEWYDVHTRRTLSAYALYVRNLMGDRDPDKTVRLLNETGLLSTLPERYSGQAENLPLDVIGWLWPVLQDTPGTNVQLEAIRNFINNRVVETAGAANFTTFYSEQSYLLLRSDRRTDAILLDALILDNPQSDLIPKLVNGLMAHRTKGRWGSTQENIFVLLALDRYFNTFEAQTPDFVAKLWLGKTYAGSYEFRGRTTERQETKIPMTYLVDEALGGGKTQDLILSKEGAGRLYYRLGLRYAPVDLNLKPVDMGFVIQRRYEAIDRPEDVYQDDQGVWHIKAGARVRVRITLAADNRRYHVALVDPLPAGLEIVNPALAVSGSTPQDPNSANYYYGWWWWRTWYEHQNLRDERAEAFTSLLWDGVYEYTYYARATTPGTFIVPPAKAEEMYSPEVFGRSSSDWVIVE